MENWEELIKLNIGCGCKYGLCPKCSVIIGIVQGVINTTKEDTTQEVLKGHLTFPKITVDQAVNVPSELLNEIRLDTLREVLPNDPTYFEYESGGRGYEAAVDHIKNKSKEI